MVIADSSVWITFQRNPTSKEGRELDSLLADDEIIMVGPVLTEILHGARSDDEFVFFLERLRSLILLDADQDTWVRAGELSLRLKRQGSMLGFADLLVSALAIQHDLPVYTIDEDFARVPDLQLYEPGT